MSILATILNTLVVILAVLLIALILVQPTKSGGGFGSAFGGLGESVFGAQAMSHLSKLTVWCISIFFVLTLASAIVAGHIRPDSGSIAIGSSDDSSTAQAGDAAASQTGDAAAAVTAQTGDAATAANGDAANEVTGPVATVPAEQSAPSDSAQAPVETPPQEQQN
jgi:preprotein translocase subunit SecG